MYLVFKFAITFLFIGYYFYFDLTIVGNYITFSEVIAEILFY